MAAAAQGGHQQYPLLLQRWRWGVRRLHRAAACGSGRGRGVWACAARAGERRPAPAAAAHKCAHPGGGTKRQCKGRGAGAAARESACARARSLCSRSPGAQHALQAAKSYGPVPWLLVNQRWSVLPGACRACTGQARAAAAADNDNSRLCRRPHQSRRAAAGGMLGRCGLQAMRGVGRWTSQWRRASEKRTAACQPAGQPTRGLCGAARPRTWRGCGRPASRRSSGLGQAGGGVRCGQPEGHRRRFLDVVMSHAPAPGGGCRRAGGRECVAAGPAGGEYRSLTVKRPAAAGLERTPPPFPPRPSTPAPCAPPHALTWSSGRAHLPSH